MLLTVPTTHATKKVYLFFLRLLSRLRSSVPSGAFFFFFPDQTHGLCMKKCNLLLLKASFIFKTDELKYLPEVCDAGRRGGTTDG